MKFRAAIISLSKLQMVIIWYVSGFTGIQEII